MYSTTTLVKHSRFTGRIVGTHQQIDKAARHCLMQHLSSTESFPAIREILHFEGTRGPDGLKRKSPDDDDPSHMFDPEDDGEDLIRQIEDHYHNLTMALNAQNTERAAFEAAWMAHKTTDALTPAHHFPLAEAREELMSNKSFVKIFGAPIKGIMHGQNVAETARNNWLYWGAGGYMTKHVAYEYGVALIMASAPERNFLPNFQRQDFVRGLTPREILADALAVIKPKEIYLEFRKEGWTRELALQTKNLVLPEIIRAVTRMWYAAAEQVKLQTEQNHVKNH